MWRTAHRKRYLLDPEIIVAFKTYQPHIVILEVHPIYSGSLSSLSLTGAQLQLECEVFVRSSPYWGGHQNLL